jgi:ribokinase
MAPQRPIIVIGSVNVDFVVRSERMARPGHTVAGESFTMTHGGKGANQAHAAALLGADVTFVGCVGTDAHGDAAIAELERAGVKLRIRREAEQPTGLAFIQVDDSGENAITIVSGANARLTPADVDQAFAELRGQDAVVLLGFEVPVDVVTFAATAARAKGWTVILNPAPVTPAPAELFAEVDIVVPNQHEYSGIRDAVERLGASTPALVVTKGRHGADIHRAGASAVWVPAVAVAAVDTTGAGDAFIGSLAWSLSAGNDLVSAVRDASAGGALATVTHGARPADLTPEALTQLLAEADAELV